VERTIKFIEKTIPDYVSVSGLCPVPGSDMFKNPQKYGIKDIDRNWEKHAHLMFRFKDEEDHGLPFNFYEQNEFGKSFTREEIINNILILQKYLRQNNMSY